MGPKPAPPSLPASPAPSDAWATWDPLQDGATRHSANPAGPSEATDTPGPHWSPSAAPTRPPAPTLGPATATPAGPTGQAGGLGSVPVKAPPTPPGR
eukprot:7349229-Lingulodinium_polyedra.AAC.1